MAMPSSTCKKKKFSTVAVIFRGIVLILVSFFRQMSNLDCLIFKITIKHENEVKMLS